MITIGKLSYKLSAFSKDPITLLKSNSYKRSEFSTRSITGPDNSGRQWIRKVGKQKDKFIIRRLRRGLFMHISNVEIHVSKDELSDEMIVKFAPTNIFLINFIWVPVFIFFFLNELSFGLYSYLLVLLVVILNLAFFCLDFSNTKYQLKVFVENLKKDNKT